MLKAADGPTMASGRLLQLIAHAFCSCPLKYNTLGGQGLLHPTQNNTSEGGVQR